LLLGCACQCGAPTEAWPALHDDGDWTGQQVESCTVFADAGACGSLEAFDLAGCDRGSLGQLAHEGIWNTHLRFDDTSGVYGVPVVFSLGPAAGFVNSRP